MGLMGWRRKRTNRLRFCAAAARKNCFGANFNRRSPIGFFSSANKTSTFFRCRWPWQTQACWRLTDDLNRRGEVDEYATRRFTETFQAIMKLIFTLKVLMNLVLNDFCRLLLVDSDRVRLGMPG